MSAQCSIDGCAKPVRARGWCSLHYQRWWLHGDPTRARAPGMPVPDIPAEFRSDLTPEVIEVCGISEGLAVRMAAYFELRLDGMDRWSAGGQIGVNDSRNARYERWFEFFCSNRKAVRP